MIAGPIFGASPSTRDGDIHVPESFYMVILEQRWVRGRGLVSDAIAFRFPNDASQLAGRSMPEFVVSIDTIEQNANLDFFHQLPDEADLELRGRLRHLVSRSDKLKVCGLLRSRSFRRYRAVSDTGGGSSRASYAPIPLVCRLPGWAASLERCKTMSG